MTPKELLFATLRHEATPRAPWVPFSGIHSGFFIGADATRILIDEDALVEALLAVNRLAAKAITDRYNVVIGGNIPLTSIMLHGTQQDNMKYVVDLLDQLPEYRNFIVAPGCDMPYSVPVENVIGAAQAALEPESVRKMLENDVSAPLDINVQLPDYAHLPRPLVEVFTLDSASCAACTYMMGAAAAAKEQFDDTIDMVEYKFTQKENIARFRKMGVKKLPSIYINGQPKFSSIIPSREELEDAIREVL